MVTIKHKLKTYNFLFTINAWFICCDELKCELHELGEIDNEMDLLINLIYGAYINACLTKKKSIKLTKDKCEKLIRNMKKSDYDKLTEAMLQAKIQGRTVGEMMNEQKKEK